MRLRILILFVFLIGPKLVNAQYFPFSKEPDLFVNDVVAGISAIGTESAKKVAYDFRGVWSGNIDDEQKITIIDIATKMQQRRLGTRPYFEHFFGLITYAVTQKSLESSQLTNVLALTKHAVDYYNYRELAEYLRTMSFFFARNTLYSSHFNSLVLTGGSFSFELITPPEPEVIEVPEEEEEEVEEEEYITEDEIPYDDGSADDGWGDDGWDSGSNNDSWNDDGWGNSGGSDDGWGDDSPQEDTFTEDGGLVEEPLAPANDAPAYVVKDKVAELQSKDITPELHGAVIHIKNVDMKMSTPFDTIEIKNTSGSFMIRDLQFIGEGGTFDWPDNLKGTDGVEVYLDKYHFKTNIPEIRTTRAKMLYPQLFKDSLDGVFAFKSYRRRRKDTKNYPRFISHYSDTELSLPGENLYYKGGFAIVADRKYGMSISEEPSIIDVTDGRGKAFHSEAVKYSFEDSVVISDQSSVVIHHGEDSIYHPVVKFDYDPNIPKLTLLKEEGDYKHTYYFSSFYRMEFKADMLVWDLNVDTMDVSILNARNMIPAVFESEEYFNPVRYHKMSGLFGFHPIMAVVRYARRINSAEFNIGDLTGNYDKLSPQMLKAGMSFLEQSGYIKYDRVSGEIKVLRKAFHYILSDTKKKDYDNILIASLSPSKPNATINFETNEMKVRGVKHVFITPDQDVYIVPDNKEVTLLKNKDMKFNGTVNAGDFQYKGTEFEFDYDDFLIKMPVIDSIRIQVAFHDSIDQNTDNKKTALHNHLAQTSGTLYINDPKNKAGLREFVQYPYFISDSEAVVYFDSPDILDGAYDKSVRFLIPPFEIDSINREDVSGIGFEGTFIAGGILPEFKEKLVIMPDKSLGFEHTIPAEGYSLYGGEGVVYNDLKLDNTGLRANGKIDYRTSTVHSDDFVFYMDSVSAIGTNGVIREGDYDGASYPEAVLGAFKMKWLPLKDSMYIDNIEDPFHFYNATASLDGEANITAKGVFGSGTMLSRGSRSESDEFEFAQFYYSARHAKFEVLTDNPEKPAMEGDDISMHFDLVNNIADVHPEIEGVAAISFPYAQMKTSITNAIWYLDSAKITMTKPENVDIHSSYFYSTREELDSLAFNASSATYDINSYELNIKGIPFIKVADAEIIPDNNETTILENSELQQFENAKLKIDTLNEYHNLFDGDIKILSRNKFEGSATYELVTAAQDTFAIKFASFELQDFPVGKDEMVTMTVSGGSVDESQRVKVAPGFFFKGDATMYADKKALELDGLVKLDIKSIPGYDNWIQHKHSGDSVEVQVDVKNSITEDGEPIVAGLLYDNVSYRVYSSFVDKKKREEDTYLFEAEGFLTYDFTTDNYKVETQAKSRGDSYSGKSLIYNDASKSLIFEGPLQLTNNDANFSLDATCLGTAKPDSAIYFMDAFMAFNMKIHPLVVEAFSTDVLDIIDRLGADVAHDLEAEVIFKLADMVGDGVAKEYENGSLREYIPMYSVGPQLLKTFVISNVDLNWSDNHRAWYNTSRIGLSNIMSNDVNARMDGFIEIKKSDLGADIIHVFLQVAPTTWYYFGYDDKRLIMYSSNPDFNEAVSQHSNVAKAGFGEYSTSIGDDVEVTKFINEFREKYFGITEPYDLEFPEDTFLEDDESFNTIEETPEDDGFEEDEEDEDDGF